MTITETLQERVELLKSIIRKEKYSINFGQYFPPASEEKDAPALLNHAPTKSFIGINQKGKRICDIAYDPLSGIVNVVFEKNSNGIDSRFLYNLEAVLKDIGSISWTDDKKPGTIVLEAKAMKELFDAGMFY